MAWLLLIIAGLLEVGWAIGLKYTEGFTRLWPSVFTLGAMVLSVVLLGVAMKSLPVGTSYAVWVGVGAVGTATPAWCCSPSRPQPAASRALASSSQASWA
jgi:quaternary ammonium compound-resistance protein SugE